MNALIACECSGRVREAFRDRGVDAWSVDLKPAEDGSPFHIEGDVFGVIAGRKWDLMIAHPPCTYLSVSGMHWTTRGIRPAQLTDDALAFALRLWNAPVPRICIENPVGILPRHIGPAAQWVQPYEFGDDASKKTGLWLRRLLPLPVNPARFVRGRLVCRNCGSVISPREPKAWERTAAMGCACCGADAAAQVPRWSNQTDSGQNRLGPGATRATERSRTYPGIAAAMAEAWGRF